jgi:hypothetical protein
MKIILFTNARDEDNILEWSIHHKNLGFDNIYIYDHLSKIPISYTLRGLKYVTVHRINIDIIKKVNLMKEAVNYSKKNGFDWLLYLDADEFLALPLFTDIKEFVKHYPNNDQIYINWILFGSNYLKEKPKGTILESYTRSCGEFHRIGKCIVKPDKVLEANHPHYFIIKDMNLSSGVLNNKPNKIRRYICELDDPKKSLDEMPAYIAHYIFQAYDIYVKRKVNRKRDDTNQNYDHKFDEATLHSKNNNIESLNIMKLYNEKNKIEINKYFLEFPNLEIKSKNIEPENIKSANIKPTNIKPTNIKQTNIKPANKKLINTIKTNIKSIKLPINSQKIIGLPNDFNCEFYRKKYKDLSKMSNEQLKIHYVKHGKKEGRVYK